MGLLAGVDIGTQGVKGVLLDRELSVRQRYYREHEPPRMQRPGWAEHDPVSIWWDGFRQATRSMLEQSSFAAEDIDAVGVGAIAPCLLPLSDRGRPLRNGLVYSDTRAEDEARFMRETLGEEVVLRENKNTLSAESIGPKLIWIKNHEPDVFEQINRLVSASNYIVYRLTDRFVLDHVHASVFCPFYDFENRCWNNEILERFGIPPEWFPQLRSCSEIAGEVSEDAAGETGLAPGTPVITSTIDAIAGALSMSGLESNVATLLYGTTSVITVPVSHIPETGTLLLTPHPLDSDLNLLIGATNTAGALTQWFRDNFGRTEKEAEENLGINAYELLSMQARSIPPGSEGLVVLPYFSGERTPINDGSARGLIMGLTTYHNRSHLYRALLEGTAYGFHHNFQTFERFGVSPSRVVSAGGGTRNELWVSIVSDVTGRTQLIPDVPVGSEIGAAYLAGLGIGTFDHPGVLENRLQKVSDTFEPDQKNHEVYQKYFSVYKDLYQQNRNHMHTLAGLGSIPA